MTVEEMVQDSLSQKLALCSLRNQNSYDFHLAKEKKRQTPGDERSCQDLSGDKGITLKVTPPSLWKVDTVARENK